MASDTVTLNVSGMTCGHCAKTVERALRGVPGVQATSTDLAAGRVHVEVQQGTARASLVAAVRGAGYGAEE